MPVIDWSPEDKVDHSIRFLTGDPGHRRDARTRELSRMSPFDRAFRKDLDKDLYKQASAWARRRGERFDPEVHCEKFYEATLPREVKEERERTRLAREARRHPRTVNELLQDLGL